MKEHKSNSADRDRCPICGSPIAVEMDGIWSYRVCTRNGHVQGYGSGAGPLASAALLYSFHQ
jgi:ribosomal protein L37AE/L43A